MRKLSQQRRSPSNSRATSPATSTPVRRDQAERLLAGFRQTRQDAYRERRAGAGLIEHRTVRLLDAHGLAEPILAHGGANHACEFRLEGQSFVLEYGELAGGRGHFTYAQHEFVAALSQRFVAAGGEIRFGCGVTGVEQSDEMATVSAVDGASGELLTIGCQIVAGYDGARSAVLGAIRNASVIELHHPFRWLTLLADVAPSKPTTPAMPPT